MAQVAIPMNNHQHEHHYQPPNETHFESSTSNTESTNFTTLNNLSRTTHSITSSPLDVHLPPLATNTTSPSTSTTVPFLHSYPLNPSQQSLPLQLPPLNLPTTSLYQLQLQQLHQQQQHQQYQQHQQQILQQEQQHYSYSSQQNQSSNLHSYQPLMTSGSNYARSTSDLSLYSNQSSQSSQNMLPSLNMVLNKINSNSSVMLPSLTYSTSPLNYGANANSNLNSANSHSLLSHSPSPINSTTTSLTISNVDNSTPNRKYKCLKCNKGFTTSGHLARHNRIHTGVKNHVCPFQGCQSRFSRQDNCMQHYKTHLKHKKTKTKAPKVPGKD
ncbi:hypothetical protein CANINC_002168 [Pichia inconspicua]|uniref:C2H2-type domain-containing protein n=1 Tax=Pichia inconspicua TaxID=52247 RepID=A0A4T0X1U3_9ASCO|nr:hypothetical protein CANINC_002168 [[Candida] inconspicua]